MGKQSRSAGWVWTAGNTLQGVERRGCDGGWWCPGRASSPAPSHPESIKAKTAAAGPAQPLVQPGQETRALPAPRPSKHHPRRPHLFLQQMNWRGSPLSSCAPARPPHAPPPGQQQQVLTELACPRTLPSPHPWPHSSGEQGLGRAWAGPGHRPQLLTPAPGNGARARARSLRGDSPTHTRGQSPLDRARQGAPRACGDRGSSPPSPARGHGHFPARHPLSKFQGH